MKNNKEESKTAGYLKEFSFKKIRKDQLIVVFLAGILLLVIAIPTKKAQGISEKSGQSQQNTQAETGKSSTEEETTDAYTVKLETKLEKILSEVEGVGKVRVMITLKGTGESIVEKDKPQTQSKVSENDSSGGTRETTESNWDESTVYIQNDDGNTVPYVSQELEPQIEGVLIIAQGGGNTVVVKNIYEAVQALFQVEIHKIKVMKMES